MGTSSSADRQFIWGMRYTDDLVLRDRTTTSSLDERLYVLHDYFHPTATTGDDGTVLERYGYDAYGMSRVMDSDFADISGSAYEWETRFGGYRWDEETELYQARNRYLHSRLGRWLTRDPLGLVIADDGISLEANQEAAMGDFHPRPGLNGRMTLSGDLDPELTNLYSYVLNRPTNAVDVLGLKAAFPWKPFRNCKPPQVWTQKKNPKVPHPNGCSVPWWLRWLIWNPNSPSGVPFKDACDAHDLCYSDCTKSKKDCDDAWLNAMLAACDASHADPSTVRSCRRWARIFYRAVRFGGGPGYFARQTKACHCACPGQE